MGAQNSRPSGIKQKPRADRRNRRVVVNNYICHRTVVGRQERKNVQCTNSAITSTTKKSDAKASDANVVSETIRTGRPEINVETTYEFRCPICSRKWKASAKSAVLGKACHKCEIIVYPTVSKRLVCPMNEKQKTIKD